MFLYKAELWLEIVKRNCTACTLLHELPVDCFGVFC